MSSDMKLLNNCYVILAELSLYYQFINDDDDDNDSSTYWVTSITKYCWNMSGIEFSVIRP